MEANLKDIVVVGRKREFPLASLLLAVHRVAARVGDLGGGEGHQCKGEARLPRRQKAAGKDKVSGRRQRVPARRRSQGRQTEKKVEEEEEEERDKRRRRLQRESEGSALPQAIASPHAQGLRLPQHSRSEAQRAPPLSAAGGAKRQRRRASKRRRKNQREPSGMPWQTSGAAASGLPGSPTG